MRQYTARIVAGLAASFLLFGYALAYWRNADTDFMVIYNALVTNDGKPQLFFDCTAYLTILTLKSWFRLLQGMGLLEASTLPASRSRATPACRFVRDWRLAMLAVAAFALSDGIAVHWRILRSELIAACPVIFALMILIAIGRRASRFRPLGIAVERVWQSRPPE